MSRSSNLKRKRTEIFQHGPPSDISDSDEEFDFESIDLNHAVACEETQKVDTRDTLTIRLDTAGQTVVKKRYPTTAIARKIRLEIHKTHLVCLMAHVSIRNKWCSDESIAHALSPVRARFKGNVHPKTTSAQIQRTRVLLEGLEALSDLWSKSFKVTQKGLSKAKWYTEEDLPKIISSGTKLGRDINKQDFLQAAHDLEGDRDVGAQLLVALLRSLGLDARLVCSLQPLGLNVGKTNLATIVQEQIVPDVESLSDMPTPKKAAPIQPRKLTRPKLGTPQRNSAPSRPKPQIKLLETVLECPYPVYWAEVFDLAAQKWYPVDPLVTETVNKPARFEPPQSETENTLSYVIGFEKDGSARDITHRYTKQFNAKVRRHRLESVPSGLVWWSKFMKLYASRPQNDRNRIEGAEFAQKELSEGVPSNVSDLKNHPLFVLERHLRKDEIIQPMRECGTITIGKARPAVVEKVYPRKFVLRLRSSLAWYMRGRQVKVGEQPLKTIEKKAPGPGDDLESGDGHETKTEGLFDESQTAAYIPFPVVNGVIPKNAYGNIDLFTPSMLPLGSAHLVNKEAEKAAQILGISYAVAVTGFDHANRMTVPVKQGIVIADEYVEALQAVQGAMMDEAMESARRLRTLAALKHWSHLLRSLRIKQHVDVRYGATVADHASQEEAVNTESYDDKVYAESHGTDKDGAKDSGGGFI